MLFATPVLGQMEQEVTLLVEDARRNLAHHSGQTRRWRGLLRRSALARAIQGSNTIEGYNVTVEDALAAAEGEDPQEADKETWAAVTGYRNAMTYIIQLATEPSFKCTSELLKSLHFMMLSYDLGKNPGRWRPGAVYVRNEELGDIVYEGPPADRIEDLIAALMAELNEGDRRVPAIVRAGMAHLNLVMIHPFSDGNGRMARAVQTLVLAREGILEPPFCSIEEYLGKNTPAYYDALAEAGGGRWQPERDAGAWIRFILTAHYRQAMTLLIRVREMEALWSILEIEVKRRGLPERVMFALADAADRFRVRNASYRTVADISENLASRDLKLLTDQGLLVAKGEKRGRSYVASDLLRSLTDRVRLPRQVADPFAEVA